MEWPWESRLAQDRNNDSGCARAFIRFLPVGNGEVAPKTQAIGDRAAGGAPDLRRKMDAVHLNLHCSDRA